MNSRTVSRIYIIFMLSIAVLVMLSASHTAYATNDDYNRVALRGTPIIDGDITDDVWQGADWQEMDVYAGGTRPKGFEAKSAILWDDDFLYTAIEVDDETHASPKAVVNNAGNLWNGDSPQHRVDLEYDSIPNSGQDIEWGYALQDDKILTQAWSGAGNIDFIEVKVVRDDANEKTYYEVAVVLRLFEQKSTLSEFVNDEPETKIGYSDMVNANDGAARLGWLEWSSGIGASKNANQFGTLTFDSTPQALDPAGKLASTWGGLKRSF